MVGFRPRWLPCQGRTNEPKKALDGLHSPHHEPLYLQQEWEEIVYGVEEEYRDAIITSFVDMFRGRDLR